LTSVLSACWPTAATKKPETSRQGWVFRGAQPCPAACQVNTLNSWITRYPVDHPDAVALRKPLRKALKQAGLPLDRVAVAVSGGPDSALMALQLAALAHKTGARPHKCQNQLKQSA